MSRPAASPSKSLLWLAGLDPRNRARDDRASLSRLVHLSITLATPAFPGVVVPRLSTTATESLTSQPGAGNPHAAEATAQCPSTRRSACIPVHSSSIIEPLSVLEHAPVAEQAPETPLSIASGPPHVSLLNDPVARLWEDAVREYQASAGVDHSSEGALLFSSKADIDDYVRDQEAQFKKFRNDGPRILRDRLMPVAIVLGKLCDGIGNSLAPAFPPGPVIFSAVGHLLRASTTVHDEFDAVCQAFDEIKCRIVLIDTVIDRHVLVREASVEFLAHVLAVFGLISKMRRAGRFRVWLQGLRSARPMSEALAHLDKLGTRQHERVAAVTLEIVTELTSSLASEHEDRIAVQRCMERVVNLAREIIASVEEGNVQAIEEIHRNREIVRLIDGVVERAANDIKIMKDIAGVDKILGWLQYRDSSDKVNKLLNDRVPSTGSWFLNGGSFIEFKDGSVKSLLMSGSAGCGKSTMTAAAFQNLQDYRESHCSDATVLVYFFDITDRPDKQTTDTLISSFLCQLALQSSEAAAFLSAHRARAVTRGHTTLEEKTALLLRLLRARRSPVYVLVDALDESVTKSIPPAIRWLQAHQAVSIFVTARTADGLEDLHDSHVRIGHFPRENDHDTNMILDRALTKPDGILAGVTDPLSIRTRLKRGAQGNLRWLSLVIDEIAPVAENPSYVSMLLTSLPQSLEAMYAQRLNSINPRLHQKVKILLAWLVYHRRPIPLDDFARLQAFIHPTARCHMPIYDASLKPSPKAAVAAIDTTFIHVFDDNVSIAHASVKDFILNLPASSPFRVRCQDAALMARMGLAYTAFVAESTSADCDSCLLEDWAHSISLAEDDHYPGLVEDVLGVMKKIRDHPLTQGILRPNICAAIMLGHDLLVDLLLHLGANIELVDEDGWPLLHRAAKHGHLNVCRVLISRGADLHARGNGLLPLHVAAQSGHAHVLEYFLDIDPLVNIDEEDANGTNALYTATIHGHLEVVTLLLSRGANVNGTDHASSKWGRPISVAAQRGHLRIMELLLNQPGVVTEEEYVTGRTTLHDAICGGALRMEVSRLCRDAYLTGREDDCPWPHWISDPLHEIREARNPYIDAVKLLLDQPGVDIDAIDLEGKTALHVAASYGAHEYIALLLARGATATGLVASGPADLYQEERWTPLHIAAARGYRDAVMVLLDHPGVSVNERAVDHRTALHFAVMQHGFDTVALLLDRGADIDAVTRSQACIPLKFDPSEPGDYTSWAPSMQLGSISCADNDSTYPQRVLVICRRGGLTPLHMASMRPCVRSIRVLCENGANIESRDGAGWSPLYCAVYCGNEDSVRVLLECGADAGTRADDGADLLCQIDRWHFVREDAATYERIRGMLLQVLVSEDESQRDATGSSRANRTFDGAGDWPEEVEEGRRFRWKRHEWGRREWGTVRSESLGHL